MRRAILIALAVVLIAAAGYATARIKRDFWDYEVFHRAGARVLAAEPLYRADDGHYQYKYWPAFALAMVPFTALPLEAGKVVWYALTISLLVILFRLSIQALPDRRSSTQFLVWWTLLLTGKFIVKELVNGQTNVLLAVLIVLALISSEEGHRARAGVLISLAAFVKPYALLFLPWLAVTQGIGALAASIAALGAGWMAPAILYGWQGNLDLHVAWYRTVTETTSPNLHLPENISFVSMWARWVGEGSTATMLAMLTTVVSLSGAFVLWMRRRTVARPAFAEVSYLLLLIPLISPQGWDYVLIVATPAYVCLLDRFRERSIAWRLATAAGFFLTSLTVYDIVGRTLYFSLHFLACVTIGALMLAGSLIRLRQTAAA
jgi:hypothetical protein